MAQKKSNKTFILGLTVALLLPFAFFVYYEIKVQMSVSKKIIKLPGYYIPDKVVKSDDGSNQYDTIYHRAEDITLTNEFGKQVSLNKDLKNRILVVNFFFANCTTVCPNLTGNLTMLQKAFRRDPKKENSLDTAIQIVSISIDPAHDSVPVLREYSDRFHVNHDNWSFFTGDRGEIYNFARNELHVSMQPANGGADDFIHSQKLVLLDFDRNIRGYYDGLDTADIKRCADDIVLLTVEKKRKHH